MTKSVTWPLIVQWVEARPDPNGNPRRLWAVYEATPPEPYRVRTSDGPLGASESREASRSYAELVMAVQHESGSLLFDVPFLVGKRFVVMPDRYVGIPEWRALLARGGRLTPPEEPPAR